MRTAMGTLRGSVATASLLLGVLASCADRPAPASRAAGERRPTAEEMGSLVPGLSSAGNSFILAWNRHDAHALAALWHEDGDFVDAAGRAASGRAHIEALFRDELGKSRLELLSGSTARMLSRNVRLEDWDVEITGAPLSVSFPPRARFHLVLVYARGPRGRSTAAPGDRGAGRDTEPPPDAASPYGEGDRWLLASARAYMFQGGDVFDDMSEHGQPLRIGSGGGEVTKPVPIMTPPPAYTEAARKVGIEGVVILEAVIDQEGLVTASHVLKTLPFGLEANAREAVERWRFRPATLHGRPVEVYDTLVVRFSLPHPPRAASP